MIRFDWKDKASIYQLIAGITGVTLIMLGCLITLSPFFPAILLAVILTLSAWPAYDWLNQKLGQRPVLASTLMTLMLAVCFIVPLVIIGSSTADNFTKLYDGLQSSLKGDLSQTTDLLKKTPYIGTHLAGIWEHVTSDTASLTKVVQDYAGPTSQWLINFGATIGRGLLDLTLGVVISYFFFRHGIGVADRVRKLIDTFAGEKGQHLLGVTKNTLIGVVYGILGTALAQGLLAAFGFWISGVPGATFLGLLTFFIAFIPFGTPFVWGPATFWLFNSGHNEWGVFLLLWGTFVVSGVDNFLRPYFISIGSNLPFIIVLLGVIGGIIGFGFIGIFIGPTLLALAYTLVLEWSAASKTPDVAKSSAKKIKS
jgi:predicted PurR-regulated permease PerM